MFSSSEDSVPVKFRNQMVLYIVLVLFVHSSLGGVLVKRQGGFGKHKPQIWSGPAPCFDKNGVMKFVSLMAK